MPRLTKIWTLASICLAAVVCCAVVCCDNATAQDQTKALELFEKHIRPTLLDQCIRCHGPKKQQGGLRLDSKTWLRKGGDSGGAVIAGDINNSVLIHAIRYDDSDLEMPPKGKLPDATIDAFEQWVSLGAPDPRSEPGDVASITNGPPSVEQGRKFWSFQSVQNPKLPTIKNKQWPITPIDDFILAKLEQQNLAPVSLADRRTLIRRAHYDLTGLPPTPKQIQDFVNDGSVTAYENLIDSLLDSQQFGQRWGRHWLDVVRFAQSSGGGRTLLFPNAWRYRDYVIDAFNEDMPYDQFIRQQIAGDLLPHGDWQDKRRKLTATAFLLLGPTNYELQDKDVLEMDVVDEQIDTIGKSMLGMTIGCARCHDHKFDPIPIKDYYALAGILRSTKAMIHSNVSTWNKVALPLPPEKESVVKENEMLVANIQKQIANKKAQLKELGGQPKSKLKKTDKDVRSENIQGIVVDDKQAELIGQWTTSTYAGLYVDGRYIHDGTTGKGKKKVVFRPKLKVAGNYDVQVSYSAGGNRSVRVPVQVHHATGETTVRINQKSKPPIDGLFVSLGIFRFDLDKEAKIVVSNDGTDDGVVIADAVTLVPSDLPPLPQPDDVDLPENIPFIIRDTRLLDGIVLDDTQAKLVGQWQHSVHTPPFVGAGYIHDDKQNKGQKSATFTPDLPMAGTYEVRVSHNTNVRRANDVPITIRHADGESVVKINEGDQAPIKKLFRSLGKFRFDKGTAGSVTFQTNGTDGKYVIVDAVQFIPDEAQQKEQQREELTKTIKSLEKKLRTAKTTGPKRPIAMVTADDSDAGDIPLAIRGVVHNKGPIVQRGVLQVAAANSKPAIAKGESGRRELADWIAGEHNPLTARVMVNRIWYWLIGHGLVRSVDNFGSMGDMPTHPELLDHLASEFVRENWSTKHLIRQIMLSRVYQLSTQPSASLAKADVDNRWLGRMNRKRLRAEDIRDTLLFVGGSLDDTFGGPNVNDGTKSEYNYEFKSTRRSVYVPVFRNTLPEIFEVFDFADPNIQGGSRTSSTIAAQALLMMNHPFVIEQSEKAAKTLLQSKPISISQAIEQAYMQVIGRPPSPDEAELARGFIGDQKDSQARWTSIYQTLFQCVDFRYIN